MIHKNNYTRIHPRGQVAPRMFFELAHRPVQDRVLWLGGPRYFCFRGKGIKGVCHLRTIQNPYFFSFWSPDRRPVLSLFTLLETSVLCLALFLKSLGSSLAYNVMLQWVCATKISQFVSTGRNPNNIFFSGIKNIIMVLI